MEATRRVKQSRARGRYGEARLAKRVNGVVVGRSKGVFLPAINKWQPIDIQHPCDVIDGKGLFAFESKWLKSVPKSLEAVLTQALRNCPTGLIPVGVIGDREARTVYYVLTERDFIDLLIGDSHA